MKFSCDKSILAKSTDTVSKSINPNNPIEILKNMKIEVSDKVVFTGSDSEISIESELEAEVYEPGKILVDSRIFFDIVKNLPEGKVELFTSDNNELKIVCHSSKFNILYLSADGYPETEKLEDGDNIRIYSKNLKEIIRNTAFAVSDDESRPILTGTYFEISKSSLKAVSIDRSKLALINQIIPETEFSNMSFVVSGKVLNDISKILKDDSAIVDIKIKDNNAMFSFDTFTIITRLLEGEFIDYKRIIPSQTNLKLKINIKNFREMIERASVIINYDNPKIPVILNIENSSINVGCISKFGDFNESIEVDMNGGELKIGVDSRLLLNSLKCVPDDFAYFEFTNEQGPFLIKPLEGSTYLYMGMPMKIKN